MIKFLIGSLKVYLTSFVIWRPTNIFGTPDAFLLLGFVKAISDLRFICHIFRSRKLKKKVFVTNSTNEVEDRGKKIVN